MRRHEIQTWIDEHFRADRGDRIELHIDGEPARTWTEREPGLELQVLSACVAATRRAELRIQVEGQSARKARNVLLPIGSAVDLSEPSRAEGADTRATLELLHTHTKTMHAFVREVLQETRDSQREARDALATANAAYATAFEGYLDKQIQAAASIETILSFANEREVANKQAAAEIDERKEMIDSAKPLVRAVAARLGLAPGQTMPSGPILEWWRALATDKRAALLAMLEPTSREALLAALAAGDVAALQTWFSGVPAETAEKMLDCLSLEERAAFAVVFEA